MLSNKDIACGFINLLIFITLVAFAVLGNYYSAKESCSAKATALGYNYSYKWFQGCLLIRKDGSRVLLEQLRDFKE